MPRPFVVRHYTGVLHASDPLLIRPHGASLPAVPARSALAVFSRRTVVLNTLIAALCIAAAGFYVYAANGITSAQYRLRALGEEVVQLNGSIATLESERATLHDTLTLIQFAQGHHMVPASDATYLSVDNGVALRQ